MSDESKHHPSCKPSDRDLVWHCNQCGLNESAADIEEQLDIRREQYQSARRSSDMGWERADKLSKELAAERESHATTLVALGKAARAEP